MNLKHRHTVFPKLFIFLGFFLGGLLFFSPTAAADEFDDFKNAKNAFEAGEFETAVSRFENLISTKPKNKGLVQETYKLLGVSYLFVGNQEMARGAFYNLLSLDPDFVLDPLVFPIDVVDFFTSVKNENAEHFKALAERLALEKEKKRQAEAERQRKARQALIRHVYMGKNRKVNSKWIAILPLGIGQFQNGHKVKGALFLGGELLLGAGAFVTYMLHQSLRPVSEEPIDSSSDRLKQYEQAEAAYRTSNQIILATLGVVAAVGLIDALYYYKKEVVTWETLKQKDVPKKYRPKPLSTNFFPYVGENIVGFGAAGTFSF